MTSLQAETGKKNSVIIREGTGVQDSKKQKIMLVDDNKANLAMGKAILSDLYDVYALPSAEKLFEFLKRVTPDLILLDIDMPGMNGYEAITVLKAGRQYVDVPIIFVTAKSSEADEFEGLSLGAIDYVTKPFTPSLLLKRIENHLLIQKQKTSLQNFNDNLIKMVKEKTQQVVDLHSAIISNMADLVEFRDTFTGKHIRRTQEYLRALIHKLMEHDVYSDELVIWDINVILLSSQLHDVGKIAISDAILNKPGKLTDEEYEIMKTHAVRGVEAIERMERSAYFADFLDHAKYFSWMHHEKWDGSGYPNNLSGLDIPLEGRIMAIADVYDALITVRPYKEAFTAEEAAKIIIEGAGSHFDPEIVKAFEKLTDEFSAIALKYAAEA